MKYKESPLHLELLAAVPRWSWRVDLLPLARYISCRVKKGSMCFVRMKNQTRNKRQLNRLTWGIFLKSFMYPWFPIYVQCIAVCGYIDMYTIFIDTSINVQTWLGHYVSTTSYLCTIYTWNPEGSVRPGVPFRSYLVRYWHWNGEKWRSPKKNIKFVSDNSVFKHLEFTKKPRGPVFSLKNVDIRCSMGCPWLTTDSPHPSGHPILGAKFRRGRHWGGILSERWWNTQPEGLVIGDKKWIGETRSDDFDHYQLLKMWRCEDVMDFQKCHSIELFCSGFSLWCFA